MTVTPPGWVLAPAAELCEKIQDGTHFSPKAQLREGPFPYITAKNVRPSGLDLSDVTYLDEATHRPIYTRSDVRKGDVLLVKDGVNAGDAAINTLDGEVSLLSSVCFLRPRPGLLAGYLRYYIQSPLGRRRLLGQLSGTAIRRVVLHRVRSLPILVAPEPMQRRIVDALDEHLSRLDAAVASLTRAKANVANARASVLKAAVEGRLVPTEADLAARGGRATDSATALLAQLLDWRRRTWAADSPRAYVEPPLPLHPKGSALPAGWTWASMNQLLAGIEAGKSFAADGKRPQGNQVGILKVSAVTWGVYDEDESKTVHDADMVVPDYFVREGDLLFSRANTKELVGTVVVAQRVTRRVMLSDKILRLRVEPRLRTWVLWALRAQHARSQIERLATGNQTSMWNIGQERLRSICIPLPPLAEQARILSELERRMSVLDQIERAASSGLASGTQMRQAILKRAFEGRLVPSASVNVAAAPRPDGPVEVVR